jgi:3-hydroxybutyryl-CoA dehydrogenase
MIKVSIIGAGTMGAGIAQIAATNGHKVCLYDSFEGAIETAQIKLKKILDRLVEKERISQQDNEVILSRINFTKDIKDVSESGLVIEAIVENLEIKQKVFTEIEKLVDGDCIIATNTSSLSIASIASALKNSERVLGIHFF